MSRGFVCIGIDTDKDKVKYAYALALSIKKCDPTAEFCLIVDKDKTSDVPKKYYKAFDYITELPYGNTGYKDGFHGSNFWQVIHCSPFEETIVLDYDVIFNKVDIGLLWSVFADYDLAFPRIAKTYRNINCNKHPLFEIEKLYNLPELYSSMVYFKRSSPIALEWFKLADPIFQNWREVYTAIFKDKKPTTFNKNVLVNTITSFLDIENQVSVDLNNFYDLDIHCQWLWHHDIPPNWTQMFNSWYTADQQLIIENSSISGGIIHYKDEMFLTEEILNVIRS